MDYKKQLFACGKHKIKCIAGAYSTLEIGPDIGRSSRRPVTATRAPKFSAAALFVDMLVMGNLVAVGADDCVYGQLALKGMNYGFIVQNGIINYEGPQIPYPYDTIPVTLYYMTKISHETPADRECYQSLLAMKSEFASSKVVQVQNLQLPGAGIDSYCRGAGLVLGGRCGAGEHGIHPGVLVKVCQIRLIPWPQDQPLGLQRHCADVNGCVHAFLIPF